MFFLFLLSFPHFVTVDNLIKCRVTLKVRHNKLCFGNLNFFAGNKNNCCFDHQPLLNNNN